MIVAHDLSALSQRRKPIALAAGFFDGVHRGHTRVLAQARAEADAMDGQAWVLTFDPHPLRVLRPEAAPRMLTFNRHKLELLRTAGMDGCLLLPFTEATATVEPEAFVNGLVNAAPTLKCLLVGRGWRFGHQACGDVPRLRQLVRPHDIRVVALPPVTHEGIPVSSTRIREAVATGALEQAAHMLGRPFSILGTVKHGHHVGRELGFPTANLDPHNEVLPPEGVYAVVARVQQRRIAGALSCGRRPTFDDDTTQPLLEVHLIGMNRDLYGEDIEISFLAYLRPQHRYESRQELAAQICKDVIDCRRHFAQWRDGKRTR